MDLKNSFVIILLCGWLLKFVLDQILEYVDYRFRSKNGKLVPEELKGFINEEDLSKTVEYENFNYKFYLISKPLIICFELALLFAGFYPFLYEKLILVFKSDFLILFFFMILTSLADGIFSLPFEIYDEFKIEKKFGFSTTTKKTFAADKIKEFFVNLIILVPLLFAAIFILDKCSSFWWILLGLIYVGFSLLLSVIYPMFIAPVFNKFTPLPEGELKTRLENLLKECDFKSSGLFIMDASKRSNHSNAYFTGFGKSKRVVLYDTLVNQLTPEEIEAVLAHELGHYKYHHITKKLLTVIPLVFVFLFVISKFILNENFYAGFNFPVPQEIPPSLKIIGIMLLTMVFKGFGILISPVSNFFSRKDEFQADAFSKKLCKTEKPLVQALIKLNKENLSEVQVPKIYSIFNYNHPPLLERIRNLSKN